MIASNIFCEAFPSPKGFGRFLNCSVISFSFSRISATVSVIFCVLVPVKWFAPNRMLSIHSVLSRSVMHGVLSQNASFCIPPESVRTMVAFFISFNVSW